MCAWQRKSDPSQRATPSVALKKAELYCAYQDRCHKEVRQKLYDLGLYGEDIDQIMAKLIEDNFLDEERYARSYARGKFRMKGWGKVRITQELKSKQLSPYCIKAGLSEIEDAPYRTNLETLLKKRLEKQATGLHPYARKQDLISYGLRKGYEIDLVISLSSALTKEFF